MLALDFCKRIAEGVETIKNTQMDAITRAAVEIAARLEKGGILNVFGSGHSHVLAEEVYARAGGLIQARAIVPHELTVDLEMEKSTLMERTDGLAEIVLATHKIRNCDALIIVSNSGRNAVPVQMAQIARNRVIFTVALTNLAHSRSVSSRDKSGKKLYELCDIVLDNCGPVGDALVPVPGKDYSIAPVSSIFGAVILEMLVCCIIETMISHGTEPLILKSGNLDGSDEYNLRAIEQMKERFPELRDVFSVI
ncbi:MAG: SIS domain-containing protein [Treponema sp.]|jgi:uncharacterized phosphosugar-binding protein|nr:SIS domain-containing protein [Treponema sp.]